MCHSYRISKILNTWGLFIWVVLKLQLIIFCLTLALAGFVSRPKIVRVDVLVEFMITKIRLHMLMLVLQCTKPMQMVHKSLELKQLIQFVWAQLQINVQQTSHFSILIAMG